MKILGIDYGRKRIGLATCGILKIANPLVIIVRKNVTYDIDQILQVIEKHDIEKIVLGLPKNMNNTEGEMVNEVKSFAKILAEKISLPIDFYDERLSSWQAQKSLINAGVSKNKRNKVLDAVAAAVILQSYVDQS